VPNEAVQQLVSIKGTPNGLLIQYNGHANSKTLVNDLNNKLNSRDGFFKGAKYRIYGAPELAATTLNELHAMCHNHGLVLSEIDIEIPQPISKPKAEPSLTSTKILNTRTHIQEKTHLIQKSLRSGTEEHFGGNVVILGDVNPSAEVSATGDIIIMGALKGTAHAGCAGNINAVIVAYKLHPSQLRIANKIARSPENLSERPYPELAYANEEDGIIIEKYNPNKRR